MNFFFHFFSKRENEQCEKVSICSPRGDICCNIAIRLAMAFENNTLIRFSYHCEIYEKSNLFKSHSIV